MRVFGMVTTQASAAYTDLALKSFFETTALDSRDEFILIDNDGAFGSPRANQGRVTYHVNPEPLGFAQNMNLVVEIALQRKADLFLLNNDLIFTPGWLDGLCAAAGNQIVSPLSNQQVQHEVGGVVWGNVVALNDYLTNPEMLQTVAASHAAKPERYLRVISVPFFCIRIPYGVLAAVGRLDELFGRGGGEDNDYCLRAYQHGYSAAFYSRSFVLHFNGRSTWGVESEAESRERCEAYKRRFVEKWGELLARLCLAHDQSVISEHPQVAQAASQGDLRQVIALLSPEKADSE